MIQSLRRLYTHNYFPSLHVCCAKARSLSPSVFHISKLVSRNINMQTVECPLRTTGDMQSSFVQNLFTTHSRNKIYVFNFITFTICKASHQVNDIILEWSDSTHTLILPYTKFPSISNRWTHAHADASGYTYKQNPRLVHSLSKLSIFVLCASTK